MVNIKDPVRPINDVAISETFQVLYDLPIRRGSPIEALACSVLGSPGKVLKCTRSRLQRNHHVERVVFQMAVISSKRS